MATHTATGEWKSFEIRMRRRRAQRLVLRADVAAEAGCLEEARASLEEARALCPYAPRLAEVQQKIDDAANPALAISDPGAPSRWKEMTAAVATMLFVAGAAYVLVTSDRSQRDHTPLAPEAPPIVHPVAVNDSAPIATPPPDAPPPTDARVATPAREPEPIVSPSEKRREQLLPVSPVPTSGVILPETSPAIRLTPPSPAYAVPALATTSPSPIEVASNPAPIQPPQESLVRSTIARYAEAYSDLDVAAVERVWPTVNRDALTRAFDSLESQQVTLADCRIQLDGTTARATCEGSARWTPKVGREETNERSWSFDLEKSADGWQITGARVQNR